MELGDVIGRRRPLRFPLPHRPVEPEKPQERFLQEVFDPAASNPFTQGR